MKELKRQFLSNSWPSLELGTCSVLSPHSKSCPRPIAHFMQCATSVGARCLHAVQCLVLPVSAVASCSLDQTRTSRSIASDSRVLCRRFIMYCRVRHLDLRHQIVSEAPLSLSRYLNALLTNSERKLISAWVTPNVPINFAVHRSNIPNR